MASKKHKILRLPELHIFAVLKFMYGYKNNLLPPIFNNFFHRNQDFHNYPTRGSALLRAPKVKTKIAAAFIKKSGSTLWNMYAQQIKNHNNIRSFNKEVITLLLSKY